MSTTFILAMNSIVLCFVMTLKIVGNSVVIDSVFCIKYKRADNYTLIFVEVGKIIPYKTYHF